MLKIISKKDEKILRKMLSLATDQDAVFTYDEMVGFLFGVAITPELIVPSEWLPVIFGEDLITVDSEQEVNRLFGHLMRVYNNFIAVFHNGTLSFPFEKNYFAKEDDLTVVQEWVYGLFGALSLRQECWLEIVPATIPVGSEEEYLEEMMTSMGTIHGVADPGMAGEIFTVQFEEDDPASRLQASLFVMLPSAVETIINHASMLEAEKQQARSSNPSWPQTIQRETPKIGRNDPCPCGSGKKFKKCCLRKEKIVPFDIR